MSNIDLFIFIAYLIGIVLFGVSFYKKDRSSLDYSTGSGTIPAWVLGLSIFATFVSSISYLALPGIEFLSNWNAYVFSLSIPIAILMAIKFFVPLYRRIGSPSAYTYLEQRFGLWARVYVASFWMLTQVMRVATILYLLALPMYILLGWDMRIIILITGVSVLIYSVSGGIKAVVWTDAIQAIILITGALVTLGIIMFSLPEGPSQFFEVASRDNKFSLGSLKIDFTESTFWVLLIYGLFINLQNYGIDQNYIQRYMSARNDKEAISSALGGGLLYVPVSLLFFMIGTGLYVYYQVLPENLPMEYLQEGMADSVFPYFIINVLPVGLTGLLIASIFAAGMSTISTSLNSTSTVFLNDFYLRFKKDHTEKGSLRVLYISSTVISIFGIIISFFLINATSALEIWWNLAGIFSGGMLGIFLLGFISRKTDNVAAIIAVALGFIVIAWMSLSPAYFTGSLEKYSNPLHNYMTIVIGTMVIFFTGLIITVFINKIVRKKRE